MNVLFIISSAKDSKDKRLANAESTIWNFSFMDRHQVWNGVDVTRHLVFGADP